MLSRRCPAMGPHGGLRSIARCARRCPLGALASVFPVGYSAASPFAISGDENIIDIPTRDTKQRPSTPTSSSPTWLADHETRGAKITHSAEQWVLGVDTFQVP